MRKFNSRSAATRIRTRASTHRAATALAAFSALVTGCGDTGTPATAYYDMSDFGRVAKFDAHVHVNAVVPSILEQARADGFELLSINVDYPDFPPVPQQEAVAQAMLRSDPARFHYASTFLVDGWGQPGWADRVNARIDRSIADGAVAVKVWKNVGMSLRDAKGRLVMIDDPAFDPVLQHVKALGIPLIGHQGEPRNCWLPLAEMTTENDRSYFREHPQYHMYLQPNMPSYEDQMSARDRMLHREPGLRFLGAHLASLEWSVDRLAAFLDANPGAVVDLAARMTQVQYQSHRDRRKVRDFFIRYQDRILYGTDLTIEPGADPATVRADAHAAWASDWTYLATDAVQRIGDIDADVTGLQLPKAVVDRIYYDNAHRVLLGSSAKPR